MGRRISSATRARIVWNLKNPSMSIKAIANKLRCSENNVLEINEEVGIRKELLPDPTKPPPPTRVGSRAARPGNNKS